MNIFIIYPHGNALNPRCGAETRMWNIISSLINHNFDISILQSEKTKDFENKTLKKKINIYYYKELSFFGISDWYLSDFNPFFIYQVFKIIRKHKFDIIIIEFPWGFLPIKLFSNKNNLLIYDSVGVESEFIKIAVKHPDFPKFLTPIAKFYAKFYEKLVCKLANIIFTVSEVDRIYYIEKYKINNDKTFLVQIPTSLNFHSQSRSKETKIKSRKKLGLAIDKNIIIFHGSLPHPPNQEAFDLIEKYIAPKISDPNVLFVIAGNNLDKFEKNNLISLGFIDNLEDLLLAADFAIVPIISGSGMRVKCSDYIAGAVPFVTTKKGIEGIDFLKPQIDYLVSESVDVEFIKNINSLLKNNDLISSIQQNLVMSRMMISRETFENNFIKLLLRIKK